MAMAAAPVGDDQFGEDPTVNALQERSCVHGQVNLVAELGLADHPPQLRRGNPAHLEPGIQHGLPHSLDTREESMRLNLEAARVGEERTQADEF